MTGRHFALLLIFSLLGSPVLASGGSEVSLEKFAGDPNDLPSLQRGASLFMNYCFGCHSLQYQRYKRTADDLGIPKDLFSEHLITTGARIGDHIKNSMDPNVAKNWFGIAPPDLTMVTRVRTVDWVYTYLKSFYEDPNRPLGVNNIVFPNVGMPHALVALQGIPRQTCKEVPVITENGGEARHPLIPGKKVTQTKCDFLEATPIPGSLSAVNYDLAVTDLVNFLDYVAEPARKDRYKIGIFVLLFLAVLFVFTYLLNREYWQNIR